MTCYPDKRQSTGRSRLILLFKTALVGGVFAVMAQRTDLRAMGGYIAGAWLAPLLLAFCLFLLNRVLTAVKWDLLLRHNGIRAGRLNLVRITFESGFVGLPSGLGPDIVRLIQIRTQKHDLTAAAGAVLADRILAVLSLAFLSGISALACWGLVQDTQVLGAVLITDAVLILLILGLMAPWSFRVLDRITRRITNSPNTITERVRNKSQEIHGSFARLAKRPGLLARVLAINVLVQIVRIAQACLLFAALRTEVPLASIAAFYPVILLIKLLPFVPFMGLGVQEGAFVYFFRQVGIPPEIAVPASLLNHLVVLAGLLPGAVLFLARKPAHTGKADKQ